MEIEMRGINKSFGNNAVLNNAGFVLSTGEIHALMGENGAGKTTLLRMICSLLPSGEGEIVCNGIPIQKMGREYRRLLGYLPQNFGYYPEFTAEKFMLYMAALKGLNRSFAKNRTEELLRLVGLEKEHRKKIKTFSGGMKRRLGIAQAMLNEPEILILDEPTAGLDVIARDELFRSSSQFMEQDEERSILISSHISSDLEGLCDDLYMIHNGKIVLHEETDVLLGEYAVLKVDEEQYQTLDKQYILSRKKEAFGYQLLTNQKQFYLENYPKVVVENGTIDEAILMMIKGESV